MTERTEPRETICAVAQDIMPLMLDNVCSPESRSFVERVCGGSVKNLVASLSDAGALTAHDIDELRAFLDAQGR